VQTLSDGELTNGPLVAYRFIMEKCDNTLVIENKKKRVMIEEMVTRKYDSDPVKAWKRDQCKDDVSFFPCDLIWILNSNTCITHRDSVQGIAQPASWLPPISHVCLFGPINFLCLTFYMSKCE
jgi:hypothetical protein